jgi:hypothetical protein
MNDFLGLRPPQLFLKNKKMNYSGLGRALETNNGFWMSSSQNILKIGRSCCAAALVGIN